MQSELDRFPLLYESYGSETRDVTVYVSTGNFVFEVLETVGEESPINGPAVPRSKFKQGTTVYVHYKVRNDGDVKDKATITVTDIDTGESLKDPLGNPLKYTTADIDPGYKYEVFKATVGTMPNKNWKLRFTMTP